MISKLRTPGTERTALLPRGIGIALDSKGEISEHCCRRLVISDMLVDGCR